VDYGYINRLRFIQKGELDLENILRAKLFWRKRRNLEKEEKRREEKS